MFFLKAAYAAEAAHNAQEGGEHGAQAVFQLLGYDITSEITTMWGIMVFIIIVSLLATRNMQKIPTGVQNVVEYIVEAILGFLSEVLGEDKAKKYLPLLASIFITILISNYSGLIPGSGHTVGLKAPTSNLSVTAGLAIVVFFTTHYSGIRERGLKYFKHFIEPLPILLPLNIIEEFIKPLSLSLRLYGNIFGEEMVVASLFALIPLFLPIPMMLLGILFGLIQAFVFTLLAAVYISTATAHH